MNRVGHFFLVIGLFILLLFFASDQSHNPQFGLFFVGLLLSAFGFFLAWRYRSQPEPSERFRALRKRSGNKKNKKK